MPEEPTGPENSHGFVGEEEGFDTRSCYPGGRCSYLYQCDTDKKKRYVNLQNKYVTVNEDKRKEKKRQTVSMKS